MKTVRELAQAEDALLAGEFGPQSGPWLGELGRGESSSTVDDTPWVPRAHGRETTYQQDLEPARGRPTPCGCSPAQVVDDLRAEGRPCARVHLKVRFRPFFTVNRSRKLAEPTWDAAVIADTALELYRRWRTSARCGCSGCGPRWCRPRVATSRRAPTAAAACPDRGPHPDPAAGDLSSLPPCRGPCVS